MQIGGFDAHAVLILSMRAPEEPGNEVADQLLAVFFLGTVFADHDGPRYLMVEMVLAEIV